MVYSFFHEEKGKKGRCAFSFRRKGGRDGHLRERDGRSFHHLAVERGGKADCSYRFNCAEERREK